MIKQIKLHKQPTILIALCFLLLISLCISTPKIIAAPSKPLKLTIHLRGVYESKVTLMTSLKPSNLIKPILTEQTVMNGGSCTFEVPDEYLPGEFVLRFDYKENKESTPYPSEKYLFINNQDLELWVSPMYCNNADSTYFQQGERENAAFARFSQENGRQKEKIGLLQNFLMSYDDTGSEFYRQVIMEYEKRRNDYNQWLTAMAAEDKELFVSSLYSFQYLPEVAFTGSETDRIWSLINHYFDGMDFGNPMIIRTTRLNDWMNNYVNLYGQMATTEALRDSLLSAAAYNAIEKARQGSPNVYGWMVDYFYRGFESNNIPAGMKVLQPYLDDPNCLTSKRQEIERRIKGMETLVQGSKAPDFGLREPKGTLFRLYDFDPPAPYILLFFWSADCSHCVETVNALYPMMQQPENRQKVSVVAISLDETETEIKAWDEKIKDLSGWINLRAEEGVRSKVANDYYILATPVMLLLDAKTKEIVGLPNTPNDLSNFLK